MPILLLVLSFTVYGQAKKEKLEVDYVNMLIGTPDKGDGGTLPGVGPPFAMTNFIAQTSENRMDKMPYVYEDTTIIGFMATHQPTVWMGDYAYVSVMPQIGKLRVLPEQRKLTFSHNDEKASPYHYSVLMKTETEKTIAAELAGTSRCGIFRFTFPESDESHLIMQGININPKLDNWCNKSGKRMAKLSGYVYVDKVKNEIRGYNPDRIAYNLGPELPNFKGYFIIQFDKPIKSFGTWSGDTINPSSVEQYGKRMGAYISFSTKKNEKVTVKMATSFISLEQARENLAKEIPDWNLEKVANTTKATWQKNLERVKVDGVTDDQRTIFYTAMYHSLQFPREFSEYGKYYSAFDDKIHKGISYNDYSLWDTFRALHPLLLFIQPERVNDMITSLLQMYKEGGWMPMWPNPAYTNIMIGTHADAVIGDAYVKGFRGYDVNLAYEAMRKNAMVAPDNDTSRLGRDRAEWVGFEGRIGLTYYQSLGYVPADKAFESVSRTLEYALDDYCVAQVAKGLGKTDDYKKLMGWSQNYRNIYNPKTGFMAPRLRDGSWVETKDTYKSFTEGSAWTYLFCVMQDIPGMIDMMGGNEKFITKLDSNFAGKHYRHSNEPGHHYIYLYNYAGQPWKTQELARKHVNVNYRNQPEGINGNDDCGQMSAWYIFNVMGFYPVTSASGEYAIGAPQFPKLSMSFNANGKQRKLEIIAKNLSEENKYIQSVTLNGVPVKKPFLAHADLAKGGLLTYIMGSKPNYNWK